MVFASLFKNTVLELPTSNVIQVGKTKAMDLMQDMKGRPSLFLLESLSAMSAALHPV